MSDRIPGSGEGSLAKQLVAAFVSVDATEQLIIFVAGTDHMLDFCQNLLELNDRDSNAHLILEVNTLCRAKGVVPKVLYGELRKVLLALNRFHDAGRDHYAVLGLPATASREEVKQAFRRLSKEFHPDRTQDSRELTQRFMEIAGAYHALMAAAPPEQQTHPAPWREGPPPLPPSRPRRHKLFVVGIILLLSMLAASSFYLAGRYNQQMIIGQLHNSSPDRFPDSTVPRKAEQSQALQEAAPTERATPAIYNDRVPKAVLQAGTTVADREEAPSSPALPPVVEPQVTAEPADAPQEKPHQPASPAPPPSVSRPPEHVKEKTLSAPRTAGQHLAAPAPSINQMVPSPARPQPETGTTSPPSATPPAVTEPQEIIALIERYKFLYCKRELSAFFALFAEHATENGRQLAAMGDQYRSLFTHSRAIVLDIADLNWEEGKEGIWARGHFQAAYTYNDGLTRKHRGDIRFHLVRAEGQLQIQALDYEFIE